MRENAARLQLVLAMAVFGTLGFFVRQIDLSKRKEGKGEA